MPLTEPKLKQAAGALRAETVQRVVAAQAGVPTFFDNFINQLLSKLEATAGEHGWDANGAHAASGDLRWLESFVTRREAGRFVPWAMRRTASVPQSDVVGLALTMSQGTSECLSWKGRPLFRTVFDLALVPMLLSELKPATVFEIGAGLGVSAAWMAALLRTEGNPAIVHAVDIGPLVSEDAQVVFHQGDCRAPGGLFPEQVLRDAPHPWLVVEDAHVNVTDVLSHMDRWMTAGDYLIVEDSYGKAEPISAFLADRPTYRVDTRYTDFFGHNATCAMDSIFRRMEPRP